MFKRFWIIKACQEDTVFKAEGVFFLFFYKSMQKQFYFSKKSERCCGKGESFDMVNLETIFKVLITNS